MSIIRNPEARGIAIIIFIILALGTTLAGMNGKLEQWFGIELSAGPSAVDKIIFVSDRSGKKEIYLMNTDGTNQKQLTNGANVISAPAISPTGKKIAFVGLLQRESQVFSVNAGGGSTQQITVAGGSKNQPGFSPNGKSLSYAANGKIYVTDLNGDNPDPVLPTHVEVHAAMSNNLNRGEIPKYSQYAWGPDNKSMASVSRDERDSDVLVYLPELEGEAQKFPSLGEEQVKITGLSWAADKAILAASMVTGKKSILLLFDADQQKALPALSVEKQEFGKPALSPDGSELVVAVKSADKKAPSGIVKLDMQSGKAGMIAAGEFENPIYSPTGDNILAVKLGENSEKRDIVIIDPSTGEVTQLTKDGHSFNAIWSPVSKK